MFKKYGFVGILLIIFAEINFFLKIQPFANWYFPIIWFGYILTIDSLVYMIRKKSLINNRFLQFLGMFLISAIMWWIFEFINIRLQNWTYINVEWLGILKDLFNFLSFGTVVPAFFETFELIRSLHIFDKFRLHKKYKISKKSLNIFILIGIISFIIPMIFPKYTFFLIWISLFFILDPINYINKQPSIIEHLEDRKLVIPLSLILSIVIMSFLWEFWNYWAIPKWIYHVPFVGFCKIFEMPILGYLGYLPFSFELYSIYWFMRRLFLQKEKILFQ